MDKKEAKQYSPLTLAFLGDAVYEQKVREKIVLSANMPVGKLHEMSIKRVCAEYQAKGTDIVEPVLSEDEADILRRGRNASGIAHPKHASVAEYRRATALECLFGYLYLAGQEIRIDELFDLIWNTVEI